MSQRAMYRRRTLGRPAIAWGLATAQIVIMLQAVAFFAWSGIWSAPMIAIPGTLAFAVVGALIASQRTRNHLGWLLLLAPLPVIVNVAVIEYGDVSVYHHVWLPFVSVALWIVNWGWTPFVGSFPVILVRFPDGKVHRRWKFVDWFAVGGTVFLAAGLAIMGATSTTLNAFAVNASMHSALESEATTLLVVGLGLLAVATVGSAASLLERYGRGDRQLRIQLKWILLAAIAIAVTTVYMAVVEIAFGVPFGDAMLPSTVVLVLIPLAIGVAVLRHQLFDIDVIVNRTVVYVMLTAILGGMYIGVIELVQRLFVLYTGETSDLAIVITAFVVAAAFTPIQKWVDRIVERRFGAGDAAARVEGISVSMDSVVRIIDPQRVARWLVDELVHTFQADGGALYLHADGAARPFHATGRVPATPSFEVTVSHGGHELGRLALGARRGGAKYSRRDVEALHAAARSLGEALSLASDLGHLVGDPASEDAAPLHEPATAVPAGVR